MTIRIPIPARDPYLGYDARQVARMALSCLQCVSPAPCTLACSREADIPRIMRLAGQAACEGLALSRWLMDEEQVQAARITDAICDTYN
jgi:NADPH-dependent glutamate synthase beta subunit-like oxidoreductase